jgi:Ca-activated chloride channel family protein
MHTWKPLASSLLIALLLVAGCTTALPPVTPSNTATPIATSANTATPTVLQQPMATQVTAVDKQVQVVAEAAAPLAAGGSTVPCCSSGGTSNVNDAPYDLTFFQNYGTNPFIDTEDDNLSTFAMDVDTASYTVIRRFLSDGFLPDPDAVRVEEVLNYFDMNYPDPERGDFGIYLEGAPSTFGDEKYWLVKVGLQARRLAAEERKDAILTFVVDVSGSMDLENRLGLVKRGLRLLVNELRPTDQVALVVYGSTAHVILNPTSAAEPEVILDAIERLQPEGATNAEAGLQLGYQIAARAFDPEAINRVILCSDGVANVGDTGPDSILRTIEDYAARDIYLSTIGFGMGNFNDVLMEQLADKGNGNYAYVDTLDEARRVFVENLTGMLQVIARDAKVQVEFDPAVVSRYRLLGYENRDIADEQFRDDTVDAGEVGAGHSVTALYEIKFHDEAVGDALQVRIRYADPETKEVTEQSRALNREDFHAAFEDASAHFQLAAAAAEYAEILRNSYWAKEGSLNAVADLARRVSDRLEADPDVRDFADLAATAARLWANTHE